MLTACNVTQIVKCKMALWGFQWQLTAKPPLGPILKIADTKVIASCSPKGTQSATHYANISSYQYQPCVAGGTHSLLTTLH